jgi:hypothetical protein
VRGHMPRGGRVALSGRRVEITSPPSPIDLRV